MGRWYSNNPGAKAKWKRNVSRAMKASAERRRCPNCDRRSAIVKYGDDSSYVKKCRWCGYIVDQFDVYIHLAKKAGNGK